MPPKGTKLDGLPFPLCCAGGGHPGLQWEEVVPYPPTHSPVFFKKKKIQEMETA